ncbi:MAG TPA: GntR family transcriptional regulator [Candidatus Scatomorpha stercoravium]|nr:GntR family transcriptional regulator [Candidatus Scatomorpha stercoravium]
MAVSLTEKIYVDLQRKIIEGEISPREFLTESRVAEEYSVSKAPAKQALHILSDQGYLISYPRRGYMVCTYTAPEVNEIQQIRRCLEGLCVRLAIERASDEEILSLRVYEGMAAHELDPRAAINTRFHTRLAELSGNPFMPETLRPLILKATMSYIKGEPDIEHFEKIVGAMLRRDVELALECLYEDIRYI